MKESMIQKVSLMKRAILLPAFCLAALFVFALTGNAASPAPTCQDSMVSYHIIQDADARTEEIYYLDVLEIANLASNARVTDVKSSNSAVATAEFSTRIYTPEYGDYHSAIGISPKIYNNKVVTGSTMISFKVYQNGKTYNLSCFYKVELLPVPFKYFKIDNKDLAPDMKKYASLNAGTGKTAKVKFKFTKSAAGKYDISYEKNYKTVKLKSGKKLSIPVDGSLNLHINLKGNAGWETERTISLARSPFKSFKINGKEYASSIGNGAEGIRINSVGKKAEISFEPEAVKNLKITYRDADGKTAAVNSGSKIPIPRTGLKLRISCRLKGSEARTTTNVSLNR